MRTTGVRSIPHPAPRPKQLPDITQSHEPPKPLPRTKFLQKTASKESSLPATLRSPPAPPVQSKCSSGKTPPPKPPRTSNLGDSPSMDASPPQLRRPGLMVVLSRPSPAPTASPASEAHPQNAPKLRPARPAPRSRPVGPGAGPTRRTQRPRLQPLSLPPIPTTTSLRVPSSTIAPLVPSRPSAAQLAASRTSGCVSDFRPAPSLTVGLRTASSVQSSVCSTEDFEGSCKEVFRNTRKAKELSTSGKHTQAASHYQVALTSLDRVLRAQVLSISQHEPTRQRLFLMQQEVFNLRKEVLNGFTDAQTAVRTPRGLPPTISTPGAPPSYDDVLKEDSRRLRGTPAQSSVEDDPLCPSRQSLTQGTSSSPGYPPPIARGSRPRPCPLPTQLPVTQRPSARIRSHSSGNSVVEDLVDVRGARSREPTTAPPPTHSTCPFKSTLISATRPKSSYHPLNQHNPPMLLPPATSSRSSLPPPLLPVSLPPASLPTQHSEATPLESRLHLTPNSIPVLDEAVLSQMRALQVYESDKGLDVLADIPVSYPKKGPLPLNKDNLQERKGKEEVPINDCDMPLLEENMKASENTVQVRDTAKNNPVPSVSSVDDPFLTLNPFPLVKPQPQDNNVLFPEEPPAASSTDQNHSQAFSDDFNPEASHTVDQNDCLSPKVTQDSLSLLLSQSYDDNLGNSILEALDFAITPLPGHRRVSPQHSRDRRTARSYSEENLLDSSHNTFEAILHSTKDRHVSRASIIEEFDPLLTYIPEDHKQDEKKGEEVCEQKERVTWREERNVTGNLPSKPASRTALQNSRTSDEDMITTKGEREGDIYSSPPDYYAEEGAVALKEEEGIGDYYTSSRYHGAHCLPDGVKGRISYSSSEDSSSMYSRPPDYIARTLSDTASPVYPCLYPEEEEEEEVAVEGRSAFYLPPTAQVEVKRRNLLTIREGIKIYFIHTDGIVTSPWKKPFLAVSRDPSKDKLFGSGMALSVGNSLWTCELQKKSTLVLRTQTGFYIFNEVARKPDCKAVAIRVPSGVRRAQQELLCSILQQNTLLEEERPKGITKAISKSATSAATRMSKLVDDQSRTPSQTFVRRNSVRALKGVSKRLTSIAEKTGGTLQELPEEYQTLQEAADTLAFVHNAKMIQYI